MIFKVHLNFMDYSLPVSMRDRLIGGRIYTYIFRMKHKKLLGAIAVAGLSLLSVQTFADSESSSMQDRPPMHGSGAFDHGSGAMRGEGMYSSYLRTDLTDTEKTAISTLMESNRTSVKTILEANGSGSLSDTSKTELQTLQTAFVANMLQYIQTDKQTDFQTKFATFSVFRGDKNGKNRPEASTTSEKTTTKKQTATEKKIGTLVDTKLATFSTDSEKIAWMEGVATKVDAALNKTSSSTQKRTLKAMKSVLEDRIDTLSGTSTTDTTSVDSLLQ